MMTVKFGNEWFKKILTSLPNSHLTLRIGLAGGESPNKFIKYLKNKSCLKMKPQFVVIDDRAVKEGSPNSNHGELRRKLGDGFSIITTQQIWNYNISFCSIDLLILGMGEDGHIASIFPGMCENDLQIRGCAFKTLRPFGNPLLDRFSLLERILHASSKVILTVGSKRKLYLLKEFLLMNDDSIPVFRLVKSHPDLKICKVY